MRAPTEHEEQKMLVEWFRLQFPGVLIYAIPNGGARTAAEAGRLKAEGVVAGMPDLHVPSLGLWIEMKRARGGRVSEAQREAIDHLGQLGQTVRICAGFEAARKAVLEAIPVPFLPKGGKNHAE